MKKRVNIDGLPGLTLQGKQGPTGERGTMTHIGTFGETVCDSSGNVCPALILNSNGEVAFQSGSGESGSGGPDSKFVAVYADGIEPIIGDSVICTDDEHTYMYRVVKTIYLGYGSINFEIETDEGNTIAPIPVDAEDEDAEEKMNILTAFVNLLKNSLISGTTTEDSTSLLDYLRTMGENDKPVTCVILDLVDTWTYSESGKINLDFDITVDAELLKTTNEWWGEYKNERISCIKNGHVFTLEAEDDNILSKIANQLIDPTFERYGRVIDYENGDSTFAPGDEEYEVNYNIDHVLENNIVTVNVFDVITNEPIEDASISVYYGKDDDLKNGTEIVPETYPAPFTVFISKQTGETSCVFAQYINITANGYAPGYYTLDTKTAYKGVINAYLWSNDVLGTNDTIKIDDDNKIERLYDKESFKIYDYVNYYNSSIPDGIDAGELAVCKFTVLSSMEESERKKVKIEAVFKKGGVGTDIYECDVCTMKKDLWVLSPSDEMAVANNKNYRHPYGRAYNMDYRQNFDNECSEKFIITIKDFGEGNKEGEFTPKILMPWKVLKDCTMEIYVYVKYASASFKKIYIGSSGIIMNTGSLDNYKERTETSENADKEEADGG